VELTASASPFVGDVLTAAFDAAQAVVVLLTPDDVAYMRPDLVRDEDPDYEKNPTPQPRPNVLFEAGMALGLHPDRTVIVEIGRLRPFSDIGGRHIVRFDGSAAARQALAVRLESAGCDMDRSGTDWLSAGDFAPLPKAVASPNPASGDPTTDGVPDFGAPVEPQLHLKVTRTGDLRYRFVVTNRGPGSVNSLFVRPSEDAPILLFDEELPLQELSEGESVTIPAALIGKLPRAQEITVQLSAHMSAGRRVEKVLTCKL